MYYISLQKRRHSVAGLVTCLAAMLTSAPLGASHAQEQERTTHVVIEGDTLGEIALRHEVGVEELRRWNGLEDDVIRPAQTLFVSPEPSTPPPEPSTPPPEPSPTTPADRSEAEVRAYVVHEWETLGCIAARFGMSVGEMSQLNQGLNPDSLAPGRELRVYADRVDSHASVGARHVVREGESLASVAEGYGVEVDDILRWNDGLDGGPLRPGRELRIRRIPWLVHTVRPGETVSEIAASFGVDVADLRQWNEGLDPDRIRVGQRLAIRSRQPPTESIGATTCGRLVNGRTLPPHPAYLIRTVERSYATDETIELIHAAFDAVLREHPNTHRVMVHDLSLVEGGPIDDHRSHQSGRDVDIAYYQRRCPIGICAVRPVLPRELALAEQWTLLEHWLRRGVTQRIFIDYGLQEALYTYARRHGVSETELGEWLQYPRGRNAPFGVIRHFRNHFDHVHVRFRCPEGDEACRP